MRPASDALDALADRHVLVTGGTDGIGKAAAAALASRGASLTLVARDPVRGQRVAAELAARSPRAAIDVLTGDLGSMISVRQLAAAYRRGHARLDVVIHSAGIIDLQRPLSPEGIERNFAVNYLGRYLLTELLDDMLGADARILALATPGIQPMRFDFEAVTRPGASSGFRAYQQSQAANDVWGVALAERLRPRGVRVAVVSPGIVKTGIRRARGAPWWLKVFDLLATPFARSAEAGAATVVQLAADRDWPPGAVLLGVDAKVLKISAATRDPAIQRALAAASARLVAPSAL